MFRKIIISALALSLVTATNAALAQPEFVDVTNRGGHSFSLPSNAVEVAPNVFSLGTAYDAQSDSMVEGYAFVHKSGQAKSSAIKGPKGGTVCYALMADG